MININITMYTIIIAFICKYIIVSLYIFIMINICVYINMISFIINNMFINMFQLFLLPILLIFTFFAYPQKILMHINICTMICINRIIIMIIYIKILLCVNIYIIICFNTNIYIGIYIKIKFRIKIKCILHLSISQAHNIK